MKQKKIGILGGSFNPIHFGHLHLAKELWKKFDLDEVWFVPARINPHKLEEPPIPSDERIKMINLAIASYPQFKVKELECKREGPSYTVDTIKELIFQYPDNRYFLLLGDDTVRDFKRWRDPDVIIRLCKIIVGSRTGTKESTFSSDDEISKALRSGWVNIPVKEVSSTEIRRRLKNGEDCSDLIPSEVYRYILENHLFN